ncbi:MAG TPA: hypothetical protein VNQ14_03830 [Woeseiaceae bacterium]|nr:hypothetical protein [Woeseiaceae bacterium]
MKTMTTLIALGLLSVHGTGVAEPQEASEEQESQGIPATPHQEQAAREVKGDLFKKLDADRDGMISKQEGEQDSSVSGSWDGLDENGDGALDSQEFSAFNEGSSGTEDLAGVSQSGRTEADMPATAHQEHAVEGDLVGQLDTDGDGEISPEEAEAEAHLSDNWDQLDTNDDGKLDSRELDSAEQ